MERIRGRAWKFGNNVDTDAIIAARYCSTTDPNELGRHCLEDVDPSFVKKISPGDVIVAGTNFGCGSSREVALVAIKGSGISAVIASSFARIFYRNAVNTGLPIIECPAARSGIAEGDDVEIDPATGITRNLTTGAEFQSAPFPQFMQQIVACGGLLEYVEQRLATSKQI